MMGPTRWLQLLAVLPENKQSKQGDEDSVLEIRIAMGPDPLQEQAGEDGGVKPGSQQQQHHSLPTGQTGRPATLPRREDRNYLD